MVVQDRTTKDYVCIPRRNLYLLARDDHRSMSYRRCIVDPILIPTLSDVERFRLTYFHTKIPTALRNGRIDATTWHELLRSFMGVKELYIEKELSDELSCALELGEVGLDPGFLPNLRTINAADNRFTTFLYTRRVVGRPVQFSQRRY